MQMFSCRRTQLKNFIKNYYENIYKKCDIQSISTDIREWKPTIGLEIHAQILTKSKLFSGASTNFNCPINSSVSFFDCAIPGTMPVLNKKCVEAGILTALALSCEINAVSMFERKHYFYSDLPAGFQITQQKKPLAVNGEIKFNVFKPEIHKQPYTKSSKIKQIQLEQDSGRSFHNEVFERSLIDLNRAGIPLMELVFEPDLTNGEEAAALVKELCFILQLLGTCSCKMEEGALRVDANVSVNKSNAPLEAGGQVTNETRAWNPIDKKTILMREKEEKHDYRFMPESNLLPLYLHIDNTMENKYNLINVPSLKEQLPELPEQIRQKLQNSLTPHVFIAIMSDLELYLLFRDILNNGKHRKPQLVAQILISEVCAFIDEHKLNLAFCVCNQKYIEKTIDLLQARIINQHILRRLLNKLLNESNKMPEQIVEENNWFMISSEEKLEILCLEVLKKNPKWVKKYKRGNKKIFKKFLHEVVTLTGGCAEMVKVSKIMTKLLS
ncbi:glutamyl-tRNA(Gln) amidotransferase subunit B, mitochondrial isoform X2 [Apis dorsata]|uniref:glutamyl-tRNA(Gln) amidotransferase subunit B, mitochondrial isoform X2 n=1 Tax=Apis dorsata TaxID=7462 RepID=UPI0003DF5D8D|nr:glutamyl-tRNA(Gln) amidotransferase subunit B, mitochondrial isoform X2 [Apis dorsata]